MTRKEMEALLRLLSKWEQEEMELLMQERRDAEREGRLHQPDPARVAGFLLPEMKTAT